MNRLSSFLTSPLSWLGLLVLLVLALLAMPLRLPIGPNYWDLYTYVDTAYRIKLGQIPHLDFFIPVGALGYGLYILVTKLFPAAHTLLAVHYAILIVALPVMALIVTQAQKRSRIEAMALVLPFMLFALVPINSLELYPSPGFDGYGNYNRHAALLLYILAANVLFVGNRHLAALIGVALLVMLFFIKITGFAVGSLLFLHALLTRRIALRSSALALASVSMILLWLEWQPGLITAYIVDIITLVSLNSGSLLPRILTVLSVKFDVIAAAVALIMLLIWQSRYSLLEKLRSVLAARSFASVTALLDTTPVWLASLLLLGSIFETQNTGSHEFILLWPAILLLLRDHPLPWQRRDALVLGLVAMTVLPTPIGIAHRAIRAMASAPTYEAVNVPLLGPVGRVSAKADIMRQSRAMLAHYPTARTAYENMAQRGVLPSYILFSEIDFQVSWLIAIEEAAEALLAYEKENKRRFARIVTLDFVDPLPVILERQPLKDLSIGNDPTRTLATIGARVIAEIASADAILLPLCPVTEARNAIANAYAPSLSGRRLVNLTPCYMMLVKE